MVSQPQLFVSANTSPVEDMDQSILVLAKARNCLTLEMCAALLDGSFPAIAGRLLALTNKGLLVKSGSCWYQSPDGYDYIITNDRTMHGKFKLHHENCNCPDWITHICALHLMDHWTKMFKRCNTIAEIEKVGEQIKRIPLDAWHVAGLRIAYKMQRDILNKERPHEQAHYDGEYPRQGPLPR